MKLDDNKEDIAKMTDALTILAALAEDVRIFRMALTDCAQPGHSDATSMHVYAYSANLAALAMTYSARSLGPIGYMLERYAGELEWLLLIAFTGPNLEDLKWSPGPITLEDAKRSLTMDNIKIISETKIKKRFEELCEIETLAQRMYVEVNGKKQLDDLLVGHKVPAFPATLIGRVGMFEMNWKGGEGGKSAALN